MENQEIQETQEKTSEEPQTSELHTKGPQKKEKNPKRVADGNRGAAVRWSKQKMQNLTSSLEAKSGPEFESDLKASFAVPATGL